MYLYLAKTFVAKTSWPKRPGQNVLGQNIRRPMKKKLEKAEKLVKNFLPFPNGFSVISKRPGLLVNGTAHDQARQNVQSDLRSILSAYLNKIIMYAVFVSFSFIRQLF